MIQKELELFEGVGHDDPVFETVENMTRVKEFLDTYMMQ